MQMPAQWLPGEVSPESLHLVAVAPVCRPGQRTTYSAGRQETVKVACEIDANPSEATYVWKFNASHGETIDILSSQVAVDRGRSIAHYTPQTENVSVPFHSSLHNPHTPPASSRSYKSVRGPPLRGST